MGIWLAASVRIGIWQATRVKHGILQAAGVRDRILRAASVRSADFACQELDIGILHARAGLGWVFAGRGLATGFCRPRVFGMDFCRPRVFGMEFRSP